MNFKPETVVGVESGFQGIQNTKIQKSHSNGMTPKKRSKNKKLSKKIRNYSP